MYFFVRWIVEVYCRLKYHIHVHGAENIPPDSKKGGFLVACNHQTYADPPIVAGMIKGKFSFIAKEELFSGNKFFAWIIRRCGAYPVKRGGNDSGALDRAVSDIENGRIFLIFPEGTRSRDGVIGKAKAGVAVIAGKANAPVLPVCIMYGLCGDKKRVDFLVGEMIGKEEIALVSDNRTEMKRISAVIMGAVTALQEKALKEYGVTIDDYRKLRTDYDSKKQDRKHGKRHKS